jgi:Reverse transcriptase (RNA-dependent DNA polymerase)
VDARLTEHINRHQLLLVYQSAYRPGHSIETAIVSIYNDMMGIFDMGHVGALVLLDMSAAFDTVDHTIVLDVLNRRFGIRNAALLWMSDFTGQRTQRIQVRNTTSDIGVISCGVPQGSVLGPYQFVMYSEDVPDVFKSHRISYRLYANDMQLSATGPSLAFDPPPQNCKVVSLTCVLGILANGCS